VSRGALMEDDPSLVSLSWMRLPLIRAVAGSKAGLLKPSQEACRLLARSRLGARLGQVKRWVAVDPAQAFWTALGAPQSCRGDHG
jgi:hypothetical protein